MKDYKMIVCFSGGAEIVLYKNGMEYLQKTVVDGVPAFDRLLSIVDKMQAANRAEAKILSSEANKIAEMYLLSYNHK